MTVEKACVCPHVRSLPLQPYDIVCIRFDTKVSTAWRQYRKAVTANADIRGHTQAFSRAPSTKYIFQREKTPRLAFHKFTGGRCINGKLQIRQSIKLTGNSHANEELQLCEISNLRPERQKKLIYYLYCPHVAVTGLQYCIQAVDTTGVKPNAYNTVSL